MSEFDQRQYRLMLQRLEWLESGDFSSGPVGDLFVLLDVLEASDPAWESDFQEGLDVLEIETAVAADRAERDGALKESYDEETANKMRAKAARLKHLVLAKIEPPADDSQDVD
jgi:hypothetical protein